MFLLFLYYCYLLCLSNFLSVIRITCHGTLFIFLPIDCPTYDGSANLISLFLFFSFDAVDVRLADRFSLLYFNICCWLSCMIKGIFVLKSNWSLLPFPLMLCPTGFSYSSREFPCFCLFKSALLHFFVKKKKKFMLYLALNELVSCFVALFCVHIKFHFFMFSSCCLDFRRYITLFWCVFCLSWW